MRLSDLKIKWKIILAASVFLPLSVGLTTYFFNRVYWLEVQTALGGLMNFADAKQQGVIRFIGAGEKLARQLAVLAERAAPEAVRDYFVATVATDVFRIEDHPFADEIREGKRHIPTWKAYHAIDLVRNGVVAISSDPAREGRPPPHSPDLAHGYSDVYLEADTPVFSFGAPVHDGMVYVHADARMLTLIVNGEIGNMEGDMGAFYLAGVGKTFDYYLVNRDNVMITESRVYPDALLKRHGSERPWKATQLDPALGVVCSTTGVYTTNAGCVTGCREAMGFYEGGNGKTMLGASMPFYDSGWTLVVEQEADELLGPLAAVRAAMVWATVALGLLSFLAFVVVISRYVTTPLDRLVHSIGTIGRTGDLGHRVEVRSADEIGRTADAFNAMAESLQRQQEEQQALYRELGETQQQLLQSEKLASIGQLAAGVAHEINNPIGYVNSNLGTLEHYLENLFLLLDAYSKTEPMLDDARLSADLQAMKQRIDLSHLSEDARALLCESREGLERVKKIVQGLRDFARKDSGEWELADLNANLDGTLRVAWNELKYKADVIKEYGDLPPVECLPPQLNQVFLNLLINAAHAIEAHGVITLRTGVNDNGVWVEIADTGKGIPRENLSRIFDPFFTTKPVGSGTGLGLSIAYGIIERHHGRISVTSEVGKGSSFLISLPIKHRSADAEA